ncbi:MAG: BamA/TamA family outer membrane protein [Bacteroidota bacterium]|nr:BamA/TamA family outer membrane protein [Bacteroidota bacterium]
MKKIKLFLLLIISINLNNNNEILAKGDTILNNNLEKLRSILNDKVIIDQIKISGNKKTKENIITRELSLKKGLKLSKEDLISIIEEDKRKVINTDLFNEVNFSIKIIRENHLEIIIDVIESFYWIPNLIFELSDRNFNDWWENFNHDFKRINYGMGLLQYNLSGRGDVMEILFRLGFIREIYASYYKPYLSKKQKGGIEIDFNFIDYDHLEYNFVDYVPVFYKSKNSLKKELSTSLVYSHRESFYNYHYFELEYYNINLNDTLSILNEDYYYSNRIKNSFNLSYEFDRDFRDIKNYPLNGFRLNINIEKNGLKIFNDINKWKARIYYSKYINLKNNYYYSFNFSSYKSSKNQPYYLYEYTDQIRGFEKYLIYGHSNITYKNTFKKRLFSTNYSRNNSNLFKRIKNIPFDFYLKILFDSGVIWKYEKTLNSNLNNRYLYSFGIGLDIVTIKNFSFTSELSRNSNKELNLSFNLGADF